MAAALRGPAANLVAAVGGVVPGGAPPAPASVDTWVVDTGGDIVAHPATGGFSDVGASGNRIFLLEDARVLPVQFNSKRVRRREFLNGGLQFSGPDTTK